MGKSLFSNATATLAMETTSSNPVRSRGNSQQYPDTIIAYHSPKL
ncbi:hypothetical protein [Rubritalea tangerina]